MFIPRIIKAASPGHRSKKASRSSGQRNRREFLAGAGAATILVTPWTTRSVMAASPRLPALIGAEALEPLKAVVVVHQGVVLAERGYHGHTASEAANIKSASKSIVSALTGIAIDKGLLSGVDERVSPLLETDLPSNPDPRLATITVDHLLSMQAGLASTSGPNYGAWVSSADWVDTALSQPFVDNPGGRMIYSTGTTHILSAILTSVSGRSMLDLCRDWFRPLSKFAITWWQRDPQGIYMGGNQMAMSTRSLAAFGELYRRRGLAVDGTRVLSEDWIDASWTARTRSRWTGDSYGYNWFLRRIGDHDVRFGWGFGGQMIYVVPSLALTVAITSDETQPSARTGYRDQLHALLASLMSDVEAGRAIAD